MARLAVFAAVFAAVLGAVAASDWWVRPFGEYYDGGALRAALRSHCLLSDELVGGTSYLRFKEDVFRVRPTTTFVVGSSRTLKIASRPGERTFANLGLPATSPETILKLFRDLPAEHPQTVYVGVEFFWFNPSFVSINFNPGAFSQIRYLLSRSTLTASIDIVRAAPYVLFHRWRRDEVGGHCVLGRGLPNIAWRTDGSRLYSFELDPRLYRPPHVPFTRDFNKLRFGLYAHWHAFDWARVRIIDQALALAQSRGWRVIGFLPPDPPRFAHLFATAPETRAFWQAYERVVPSLFRRHGFRWLDLHDARSVPCSASEYVDGGFHPDAGCSQRLRKRLDRAAAAGSAAGLTAAVKPQVTR